MRTTTTFLALAAATFAVAGCGGGATDAAAAPAGASDGAGIVVEAGDLYFEPESLSATAGEVSVTLDNVGSAEHDFVIEELDDFDVVHAAPGTSAAGTVTLEAGTYTYYCSVPGHRTTMEGTLEIS
ncbi:MAG: cupredoxin domain-containing protein [Dehalococcoidia bacterium]